MNTTINGQFSISLLNKATVRHWWLLSARICIPMAILFAFMLFVMLASPRRHDAGSVLLVLFTGGLLLLECLSNLVRAQLAAARVSLLAEHKGLYKATDDGLELQTPLFRGWFHWVCFRRLVTYKALWLLFITDNVYYIIPAESVAGGVGDFIVAKVRENGGKVKKGAPWSCL